MNKKGFTLAEIMGVIILLAIVAAVTIPSVERYITSSKQKSYNATVRELISSAKKWNTKYGGTVSWLSNDSLYVLYLSELKGTEFLSNEDVIDPRDKTVMNGCIIIRNDEDDAYTYDYSEDGCDISE